MPVDLVTRNNERVDCLANAIVERSEAGDYLRTIVVYTEVGAQARLEQHYRELYRATPAMLHTVDNHGRITNVSDRWLETLGLSARRSARPRHHGVHGQGDASDARRRPLGGRHRDAASSRTSRAPTSTKSGDVLEVEVSATGDRDPSGAVVALLVASKDVTARNRAERQLRAAFEENARLRDELERERDYLREEVQVSMNFGRIIGESPALKQMLVRLEAVAQTSASVLIEGESGVGKELVAHVDPRAQPAQPRAAREGQLRVDSARAVRERVLRPRERRVHGRASRSRRAASSSPTAARSFSTRSARFRSICRASCCACCKRASTSASATIARTRVDVRVIAATNRDLEKAVADGSFREDLFYRLSVFPIEVPPLRARGDDVIQIASHFLERTCQEFGHRPLTFSKQQAALLKRYDWPGNIRELKNVIERAVILSRGKVLRLDLAMSDILNAPAAAAPEAKETKRALLTELEMRELERKNTLLALEMAQWRVSGPNGAAKLLGVKPTTLTDRMKKFKLRKPS